MSSNGSALAQQALLVCGAASALLQIAADRVTGSRLEGYDFSAQSMSDLTASGSPVRPLALSLAAVAAALMVAFGIGVWRAAGQSASAHAVALLIIGNASLGLVAAFVFPPRLGIRPAFATPGVLLMFLSVLCFVLAMIVGAVAYGGWMRVVSIAIPVGYVVLAIWRFAIPASTVATIGVQERTMAFSYLVWVIALSVYLLAAGTEAVRA